MSSLTKRGVSLTDGQIERMKPYYQDAERTKPTPFDNRSDFIRNAVDLQLYVLERMEKGSADVPDGRSIIDFVRAMQSTDGGTGDSGGAADGLSDEEQELIDAVRNLIDAEMDEK